MTIETRYDTCAVCASDEDCALIADKPVCGDCCEAGMLAAGVDHESEVEDLKSEVADHEETITELREKIEKLTKLEADTRTALREQEAIAIGLAKRLDAVKRITDGIPLLPEPKPKKPRAKKAAEVPAP